MARARRKSPAEPSAWVTFAPVEGRPVVPQHEEWSRDFIEWRRGPGQSFGGLEWMMDRFREAHDIAATTAKARGEFYTTSAMDWARHLLGPEAEPREVERLSWELWEKWKPHLA